jgi:hypothetical protein
MDGPWASRSRSASRSGPLAAAVALGVLLSRGAHAQSLFDPWDQAFKDTHDRNAPLRQFEIAFGHDHPPRGDEAETATTWTLEPTFPIPALGPVPRSVLDLSLPIPIRPEGGLGDLEVYDTFVVDLAGFGSLGLGPGLIAPTATADALGQGKWQLGVVPSLSVTALPNWTIGFTARNYASVGGDGDRPDVSQLLVEPVVTRTFPRGWFVGHSDFDWQVDWHGEQVTLPLGLQAGRVFAVRGYLISLSIESAYVAVRPAGTDPVLAAIEATLYFRGLVH